MKPAFGEKEQIQSPSGSPLFGSRLLEHSTNSPQQRDLCEELTYVILPPQIELVALSLLIEGEPWVMTQVHVVVHFHKRKWIKFIFDYIILQTNPTSNAIKAGVQ